MNSRIVAGGIKNEIWPLLRKSGFAEFTIKTAWRHLPEQIHVVNFQSFNTYLAEGLGCTTFSFALNIGIYFRAIPVLYGKEPDPPDKPQEYHCHFRLKLSKGIEQSILPRRDIWYVQADGCNLLETLGDARAVLQCQGLPWFDRFGSLEEVLHLLLEVDELPEVHARQNSPGRKHMIGHIALSLGRTEIAGPMIAEAQREFESRLRIPIRKRRRL